jgi:hypothetical protein
MATVKLATNLQTLRSDDGVNCLYEVFYAGRKLGYFRLRRYGTFKGQYVARVLTDDVAGSVALGFFDPADYKSFHAARKAAAEAVVVAHDKLIDGEAL